MSGRKLVTMTDGGWRKALSRIARSDVEVDREEQARESGRLGGTPVASLPDRCRATVCGSLTSVTVRPKESSCCVEAELFDGSGEVRLRWIGRSAISGIEPGRRLRASGTVSHCEDGHLVIYNPTYELLPDA